MDTVHIEGLLIDTRIPAEDICKICRQKDCEWKHLPSCHFCPGCLITFCSSDSQPGKITICPECPQYLKVCSIGPVACPGDPVATDPSKPPPSIDSTNYDSEDLTSARSLKKRNAKDIPVSSECGDGAWESEEKLPKTHCDQHPNVELTFFCVTCEIPLCDFCVAADHGKHFVCKRFEEKPSTDLDDGFFEDVKGSECEELCAAWTRALGALQEQHNIVTDRILVNYEISKAKLEKWRDFSLQQQSDLLAEQESQLTEIYDNLKRLGKHSEATCEIVIDILQSGNALDILSLKNFVKTQLLQVIDEPMRAADGEPKRSSNSDKFARPETTQKTSEGSKLEEALELEKAQKLEEERKLEEARKKEEARRLEEVRKLEEDKRKLEEAKQNLLDKVRKLEEEQIRKEAFQPKESGKLQEVAKKLRDAACAKSPVLPNRDPPVKVNPAPVKANQPMFHAFQEPPTLTMDICLEFGTAGDQVGQFSNPKSVCVNLDGDICVADSGNNRIQVFSKNGHFKFEFGGYGFEDGQLNHPLRVAAFKDSGKLVVADMGQLAARLQLFSKEGKFIRRIVTRSAITSVFALSVLHTGNIAVVDREKAEIFVINDNGELLLKFGYKHRLVHPTNIMLWGNEFYVNDFSGHAVVVFGEDGTFKRRFESKLKSDWYPGGMVVLDDETILIGYSSDRRFNVVGLNRLGQELFFSRCPPRRVTTCCGMDSTADGKLVMLAKNESVVIVAKINFKGK